MSFVFVEPWHEVTRSGRGSLEEELCRELAPGHPLFRRPARAVARRHDRDDVLFELTDTGQCAVVHLTWVQRPERPPFPTTTMFESVSAWGSTAMMRDHEDLEGAP